MSLEGPTDFSEGRQLLPAGDERAGAAEAVTLAGHLHVVDDGLHQHYQDNIVVNLSSLCGLSPIETTSKSQK